MFRRGPARSPGPRWEALQEPAEEPTQGSSDDESENTAASGIRNVERAKQPLKRKDNDRSFTFASAAKRPRHEKERNEGQSSMGGSISVPAGSSKPSSQAGPSRFSNHAPSSSATSISAGPPRSKASSSASRTTDASQASSTSIKPLPKPSRSQYSHITVFSGPERDSNGDTGSKKVEKSSIKRHAFASSSSTRPSSSTTASRAIISKGKKPASQANKSTFATNEVIEISSDSEPSPRAKPTTKPLGSKAGKLTARKRVELKKPLRKPLRKLSPDIIIIDDSDDEPAGPPIPKPVRDPGSGTKVTKRKVDVPPSSHKVRKGAEFDEVMETDNETGVTSTIAPDVEMDQIEHPPLPAITFTKTIPPTATTPLTEPAPQPPTTLPHSASPPAPNNAEPSASASTYGRPPASQISSGTQSSAKKPTFNQHGRNPFSAPSFDEDVLPPSPSKRNVQSATKTASLRTRTITSSPSSGDENSTSSDRSRSATGPEASSAEDGIDMRNLSDALDVAVPSNRPRIPENVVKGKQPVPQLPEAPKSFVSNTQRQTKQGARKSTGGVPPKVSGTTKPASRKPEVGISLSTLADVITSAGKINAISRHRGKERGSITSLTGLTSDREENPANNPLVRQAKASDSRSFAKPLSASKEKMQDAGPSSIPSADHPLGHARPMTSRSSTDELLLRPSEPSPPASPSPALQTPSTPGLQLLLAGLPFESGTSTAARRRSAPSLSDAFLTLTAETQVRPSVSVLQSPRALGSGSRLSRVNVQVRPYSMDSVPRAEIDSEKPRSPTHGLITSIRSPLPSPKLPARQVYSGASSFPISPRSPKSPHSPRRSTPPMEPASSPSRSPKTPKILQGRISSLSPHSRQQSSLGEVFRQAVQEKASGTHPSTVTAAQAQTTVPKPDSVSAAQDGDDIDMATGFEGRSSSVPPSSDYTDDEAMDEVAEVEALVEEDGITFESDREEGTNDSSLPDMTRRSSRVSSRSSTSENWPVSADDNFASPEISRQTTPEESIVVHHSKTYGGFSAITWPDHVKTAKNLPPKCVLAKDIPHVFEDHVNNMTAYTRMMPEMRKVYEARIMENTVEDEPDAPPIEIQNDVDEEATPPWEFYYSNQMWHGEGVPLPDTKSLVRCNCKGVCNPKSKTCACLKRQREACQDPTVEFAYDKTGKLKIPGYPIFECNDLCGCGDECRNRVVQHGRKVSVAVRKTLAKGWGVFATKKILAGSFIGIYAGELITDVVAQSRGVKYNKFGRTYLFDVDFHHLRDVNDVDWTNKFTVDAYHAGNFTRFLNHSCDPNSRLFACYVNEGNIQKPLLVIFSLRDIESNEEICFNYNGEYPGDEDENDENNDNEDNEEPHIEGTRDLIYERCMCGAYNCTGVMFK